MQVIQYEIYIQQVGQGTSLLLCRMSGGMEPKEQGFARFAETLVEKKQQPSSVEERRLSFSILRSTLIYLRESTSPSDLLLSFCTQILSYAVLGLKGKSISCISVKFQPINLCKRLTYGLQSELTATVTGGDVVVKCYDK